MSHLFEENEDTQPRIKIVLPSPVEQREPGEEVAPYFSSSYIRWLFWGMIICVILVSGMIYLLTHQ